MIDVAVVILAYNEQLHIRRALESVHFAREVFVIDSGSTDGTREIARDMGATVLEHGWTNHAQQLQWALDNAPFTASWILRLDADEIIHRDLAERLASELKVLADDVVGVTFDRRHIFAGRWIKHGGRYPLRLLRLFRRGHGRVEQRWMDEHIVVHGGRIVHFAGGFSDHNLQDLTFFTAKHNTYATREALEVLNQRLDLWPSDRAVRDGEAPVQTKAKRWIKERIYNRVPFELSTLAYFMYRYVAQLGFLDGRAGLTYHVLQGYWYRFLVGAKVVELASALDGVNDKDEMLDVLSRRTGIDLRAWQRTQARR